MISSILILAALATGIAAETFFGIAKWHDEWSGVSCGGDADGTTFIMALNPGQFGGGANPNLAPVCGKTITVNHGGKSIVVTVVSKGGMPLNDFDLSKPAFEQFASTDEGTIPVTWSWNDFDPATDGTAAADTTVATVGTSVTSTPASEATALAAGVDAAAVTADTGIASAAPVEPSAVPVAPVVSAVSSVASSASAEDPGRPTGYGGGGRQSKRCAAQL